MSEVFVGLLQPFAFPFAPRDWMLCNGALLSTSQHQTLFALIGITYGGDGVNTFAIPDTRGRTLVGQGHMPGGQTYTMGQAGGLEAATLTQQNMGAHTHMLVATAQTATHAAPVLGDRLAASTGSDTTTGNSVTVRIYAPAGAGQPLEGVVPAGDNLATPLLQPYLVNNYCIALQGLYPSRN